MKYLMMIVGLIFCTGCMFVNESYSPAEGGGYDIKGSCVGYAWKDCRSRTEALCAEPGQTISGTTESGGPQNDPGIAIIPKRVHVQCKE